MKTLFLAILLAVAAVASAVSSSGKGVSPAPAVAPAGGVPQQREAQPPAPAPQTEGFDQPLQARAEDAVPVPREVVAPQPPANVPAHDPAAGLAKTPSPQEAFPSDPYAAQPAPPPPPPPPHDTYPPNPGYETEGTARNDANYPGGNSYPTEAMFPPEDYQGDGSVPPPPPPPPPGQPPPYGYGQHQSDGHGDGQYADPRSQQGYAE